MLLLIFIKVCKRNPTLILGTVLLHGLVVIILTFIPMMASETYIYLVILSALQLPYLSILITNQLDKEFDPKIIKELIKSAKTNLAFPTRKKLKRSILLLNPIYDSILPENFGDFEFQNFELIRIIVLNGLNKLDVTTTKYDDVNKNILNNFKTTFIDDREDDINYYNKLNDLLNEINNVRKLQSLNHHEIIDILITLIEKKIKSINS